MMGTTVLSGILEKTLHLLIEKQDWRIEKLISVSMQHLAVAEYKAQHPETPTDVATDILHLDRYHQLRLVVDWIAGMTDKYALDTYHFSAECNNRSKQNRFANYLHTKSTCHLYSDRCFRIHATIAYANGVEQQISINTFAST